jgi:hypothetical protein
MLPEEMWLEWLKDEIMCEGSTGESSVESLFRNCFADYLYEKVAYKYLKYLSKNRQTVGAELVKQGFESIVEVYGLGGQRCDKIFRLYY